MPSGQPTAPISRADLAQESLEDLRRWPGCEAVVSVGVLSAPPNRFLLRVMQYGRRAAGPAYPAPRATGATGRAFFETAPPFP
jgi:hypothetical protein